MQTQAQAAACHAARRLLESVLRAGGSSAQPLALKLWQQCWEQWGQQAVGTMSELAQLLQQGQQGHPDLADLLSMVQACALLFGTLVEVAPDAVEEMYAMGGWPAAAAGRCQGVRWCPLLGMAQPLTCSPCHSHTAAVHCTIPGHHHQPAPPQR